MPYVSSNYYISAYYGTPVQPEADFPRYEARAEDIVDMLTGNKVKEAGIENLPASVAELVRKAVCAQIEWYCYYGYEASVIGAVSGGFTVGKVSVGGGGKSSASGKNQYISPACIAYLEQSGLLLGAVPVLDRWWL